MTRVLFTIDKGTDLHTRAQFNRYIDTLSAMCKVSEPVHIGIGHWVDDEGVSWLEDCYSMTLKDFTRHIQPHGWCNDQDSVIVFDPDHVWIAAPDAPETPVKGCTITLTGDTMPAGNWVRFHNTTGGFYQVLT